MRMATGVILLQRVHHGLLTKMATAPSIASIVRCLQNCLCPPSQANRAGKMESQTREGRGEGSRPAGTRRAEQRMLSRQRKLQAGEHGPAASVQAGSSVGGNVHMQKAPGTPAPRTTPPAESHSRSCTDAPAATMVTSHMQRFHPCHHMSAPQLESSAKVPQGTLRCCGVIAHFRHQT